MARASAQLLLLALLCLVSLVAIANAQTRCDDYPGFTTYIDKDHRLDDLNRTTLSLTQTAADCLATPECLSFNSVGYIKSKNTINCPSSTNPSWKCQGRCFYQRVIKPYRTRLWDTYDSVASMFNLNASQLDSINPRTRAMATLPAVLNVPSDTGDTRGICDPRWHLISGTTCCAPGQGYSLALGCFCIAGTVWVDAVSMCVLSSLVVAQPAANSPSPLPPPSLQNPTPPPPSPPTAWSPSPLTRSPVVYPSPRLLMPPPMPIGSNRPATSTVSSLPASRSNTAAVAAGAATGGALAACLATLAGIWLCRKRRRGHAGDSVDDTGAKGAAALVCQDNSSALATITIASNTVQKNTSLSNVKTSKGRISGASTKTYDANNRCVVQTSPLDVTTVVQNRVLSTLRIPWSDIELGQQLGQGGFGTVYLGSWKGNKVAVKMLNKEHLSEKARAALHHEVLMMCELRHPCIAPAYGLIDDGDHHALVMRYYKRGTLANAMRTPAYERLDLVSRLKIALQVATGISRLHEAQPRPIIHGDLKTSNILLDDDGSWRVVIADFGLACSVSTSGLGGGSATMGITVSISPPEVLQNPCAPRTLAVDSYAFGIVLLEIMQGAPVYRGMKADEVINVVKQGRRSAIPASIPQGIVSLIEACWSQDPVTRPGFSECIEKLRLCIDEHSCDGTRGHDYLNTTTAIRSDGAMAWY